MVLELLQKDLSMDYILHDHTMGLQSWLVRIGMFFQ